MVLKHTKASIAKIRRAKVGKNNPKWKGNKVGFKAIHSWAKRNKAPKKMCEYCGKAKAIDLSNVSGKYKRSLSDFKWACRKCHMKYDGRTKYG